jgi:hypothetical protein
MYTRGGGRERKREVKEERKGERGMEKKVISLTLPPPDVITIRPSNDSETIYRWSVR